MAARICLSKGTKYIKKITSKGELQKKKIDKLVNGDVE